MVAKSATFDRLCLSFGSQAIAVHLASVPELSQVQVLQSSMKAWFGMQVKPGSLSGTLAAGGGKHKRLVQIQTIPFAEHLQRLQS